MRNEYDFSKSGSNPYIGKLEEAVTLKLEAPVAEYFKHLAAESGVPLQVVISLYLKDCVQNGRQLSMEQTEAK